MVIHNSWATLGTFMTTDTTLGLCWWTKDATYPHNLHSYWLFWKQNPWTSSWIHRSVEGASCSQSFKKRFHWALESLDISQNKLSGEIPPKPGDLSSLGWINVSHNELVGPIPQGTQFQRQNCSSYEGNTWLYGASLKDIFGDINGSEPTESSEEEGEDEEEEEEEKLTWTAARIGFAPGVVLRLTIGYVVASYKQEWFLKSVVVRSNKHWSTR